MLIDEIKAEKIFHMTCQECERVIRFIVHEDIDCFNIYVKRVAENDTVYCQCDVDVLRKQIAPLFDFMNSWVESDKKLSNIVIEETKKVSGYDFARGRHVDY